MASLLWVEEGDDLPEPWQKSSTGSLLECHTYDRLPGPSKRAELPLSMGTEKRRSLKIPDEFAYIMRGGGAKTRWTFSLREGKRPTLSHPKLQVAQPVDEVDEHLLHLLKGR